MSVTMKASGYELEAVGEFVFDTRDGYRFVGVKTSAHELSREGIRLLEAEQGLPARFRVETGYTPAELRDIAVLKKRISELEAKLEAMEGDDG